ncbi:hypothetical protein BACSTE_00019 [Bacteroides stercoris ATCC 43183]|uniref:Uncharacterized protein n=1 Tax=Bacteroides stercoris ATCC 43183 TaxID=449673 RepID=B0NKQ4_BACSE|nr:hypothetical protein BACSTE_00463 [Bacteroides stercoris ATCC 43183]EDS17024.1 hypothetical protein BACSTE_00019 [Bacteroides stercoris ATCC 43183]
MAELVGVPLEGVWSSQLFTQDESPVVTAANARILYIFFIMYMLNKDFN